MSKPYSANSIEIRSLRLFLSSNPADLLSLFDWWWQVRERIHPAIENRAARRARYCLACPADSCHLPWQDGDIHGIILDFYARGKQLGRECEARGLNGYEFKSATYEMGKHLSFAVKNCGGKTDWGTFVRLLKECADRSYDPLLAPVVQRLRLSLEADVTRSLAVPAKGTEARPAAEGAAGEGAPAGAAIGQGVSMLDGALLLDDEKELARQTVDRWQKQRKVKRPASIGLDRGHSQVKLYSPKMLAAFVAEVECKSRADENRFVRCLAKKARPIDAANRPQPPARRKKSANRRKASRK